MDSKQSRKEAIEAYKNQRVTGGVFAVCNTANGKKYLAAETNLKGSENRFKFAQRMNTPYHHRLARDWAQYGPQAFTFEVLEELEKKDEQSLERFRDDLNTFRDMWAEKYEKEQLY